MSASLVFGQANLTTANCSAATGPATLGNSANDIANSEDEVFGVAVDANGNLWVADDGNNRVLEYTPPFSSGMAATLAIGQPDLVSGDANQGNANPTASSLFDPGCTIDPSGNLWVADFYNNRLLEFVPPFHTGMAASLVLGQSSFTAGSANRGGAGAGANTLFGPNGLAFDASGNLWLSDASNNRVLEFQTPFTNGMSASLVLGQVDLSQNMANQGGSAPTAATLSFPEQISFDSNGRLFVDDSNNNRTVVFTPPFSTGMNASMVIGQANATSATAATTATGQSFPTGLITTPPLY